MTLGHGGGSGRPLSLHPTTLAGAGPLEVVTAAARAGFELVDVRLAPAHAVDRSPSLLDVGALRRALRARLAGEGVGVLTAEVIRLDETSQAGAFERHLEVAAELGARFVLAVSHDEDAARTAHTLAELAGLAAPRGLRVVLEFMAFTAVRTAPDAGRVVAAAAHPALGLCADVLHLARSGGSAADLRGLPVWVGQLCDAPATPPDDLAAEARGARLLPGEGDLPVREFVEALPAGTALSVEATTAVREDWDERARRARNAALAVLS